MTFGELKPSNKFVFACTTDDETDIAIFVKIVKNQGVLHTILSAGKKKTVTIPANAICLRDGDFIEVLDEAKVIKINL